MKGVNKCGVLLALSIISLFTLSQCSDVNALQHTYQSINAMGMCLPPPVLNQTTNKYELDWNTTDMSCYGASAPFLLYQEGDAIESTSSENSIRKSASYMRVKYQDGQCQYDDSLNGVFDIDYNNGFHFSVDGSYPMYHPLMSNLQGDAKCKTQNRFGESGTPSFKSSSLPSSVLQCNLTNGAVCGGLWKVDEYINENVLPYYFTFNGIYLQDKFIDEDGFHYSNSFNFNQILTNNIHKFSKLQIPLWTYDNYFVDSSNFWAGRQLEFKGAFEFDGSFAWHDNINNNGSSWKLYLSGFRADTGEAYSTNVDCTANLITVGDLTRLEYTCPITLEYDLLNIYPSILIDGNNQYVFETDNDWRFSYTLLTTDNDTTKGETFGQNVVGADTWAGSAKNNADITTGSDMFIIGGVDFESTLVNLFGFNFLNPFAPLFNMFSNNYQCTHIPIIAGMLHAESDEVCPWFPSSVRNIATPVLSIASMMLIFGFAVRWLGARSGNMFEDAVGGDIGDIHIGRKGGK